jgi:NitT/TauT family transport system permease protein
MRRLGRWAAALGALTLAWYGAALLLRASGDAIAATKLPYPHAVLLQLAASDQALAAATLETVTRALAGLAVGGLLAFLVGVLMAESRLIQASLLPYVVALQTIPLVALVPLLRAMVKDDELARVLIAGFITFLVIALSVLRGLRSLPPVALDLLRSYDAGRAQVLWRARIPAALPFLFSGLRVAAPLSLVGAVVVDLLGSAQGLGFVMLSALTYSQPALLWASILITAALGALMAGAVSLLERRLAGWQPHLRPGAR